MKLVLLLEDSDDDSQILVKGCARCGEDHPVSFFMFTKNPIKIGDKLFDCWGICPTLSEPILMMTTEN